MPIVWPMKNDKLCFKEKEHRLVVLAVEWMRRIILEFQAAIPRLI